MSIISAKDAKGFIGKQQFAECFDTYRGHCGQGLSCPLEAGGWGRSSKFVTDFAP